MVGEPRFFVFLDAADRMAIGEKIVLSGKSILSRKSQGFPCSYMGKTVKSK